VPWRLRGCPRCGGALSDGLEIDTWSCLQCGRIAAHISPYIATGKRNGRKAVKPRLLAGGSSESHPGGSQRQSEAAAKV